MIGQIVSGSKNNFLVDSENGLKLRCTIKGKKLEALRGWYNSLTPGDMVHFEFDPHDIQKGHIHTLIPRKNVFKRFNEKGKSEQSIASNIDTVVCITSTKLPPFRPRFIDRVSIIAQKENIPMLIIINKTDLRMNEDTEKRLEDFTRIGYDVLQYSVLEKKGIDDLKKYLTGKTTVLIGQSGVGKSSILNSLGDNISRRVGDISRKFGKGKHTTAESVMLSLDNGSIKVIDTPGFRRLAIRGIDLADLSDLFVEFRSLSVSCFFGSKCLHINEKDCAVIAGLKKGLIHMDRYQSYLNILDELKNSSEPAYILKKNKR